MIRKNEQKFLLLVIALFLFVTGAAFAQFTENMDVFNTSLFSKSDGWTNGAPFNCYWRATCVTFSGGYMSLTLDYEGGTPPYKSGEYRSLANYLYGLYEVRMKAAKSSGIVTSFFTYTGPSEGNPWDEIDIEILGKDPTQMQTNYFTNGVGGHETMINLGFDSSAGFHTYGFEWLADRINWYVDGVLVHTENGSRGALPVTASKIMMNLWPGIGVDAWLGVFPGTVPLVAQYDWVRFTPQGSATATATTVTRTATATTTRTATTLTRTATATTITRTATATRTSTSVTRTATRTATTGTASRTATATATSSGTCTCDTGCTSLVSIAPNFSKDGAGQICYSAASLGNYINSWNLTALKVNGVDFTNKWTAAASLPAKIGGLYYVYYNSAVAYGHFEAMN